MLLIVVVLAACCLSGLECHPQRPDIPDMPVARHIFETARANQANVTGQTDMFLSEKDMADIFGRFDINDDGLIDETEFIAHWTTLKLGDLEHAVTLFHRADTDKDGTISKSPDYDRLFYYFDRDADGKISEDEFITVWFSLSS